MVPILDVYDGSFGRDARVGRARFSLRRGSISTTFVYDDAYLASRSAYMIDPALPLRSAASHCAGIPGIFRDSSPDRWGRNLIMREHRDRASDRGSVLRQLDEVDYLVGVLDMTREGSLRFCEPDGEPLSPSQFVPPLVQLPELLAASRAVAANEGGYAQIKELLEAGSGSLGGARPKASVCDGATLLLAKFPHPQDGYDIMAWEHATLAMARDAGISTATTKLLRIGGESALLSERFDRSGSCVDGDRIPYMSAMTALQAKDGETRDHAELAEAIPYLTDDPKRQLESLFARIAFSIAVHNTDDHLRNIGFLRRGKSWELAPSFDVNPNPIIDAPRVTAVLGERGERESEALKDLSAYAGLSPDRARKIVEKVLAATARWRDRATKSGCSEREMRIFGEVFKRTRSSLQRAFGL